MFIFRQQIDSGASGLFSLVDATRLRYITYISSYIPGGIKRLSKDLNLIGVNLPQIRRKFHRTRFSDHCANTVIQTTSDPLYKVQVGWEVVRLRGFLGIMTLNILARWDGQHPALQAVNLLAF